MAAEIGLGGGPAEDVLALDERPAVGMGGDLGPAAEGAEPAGRDAAVPGIGEAGQVAAERELAGDRPSESYSVSAFSGV